MPAPIPFDFEKRFKGHDEILDFIFQKPGTSGTLFASDDINRTRDDGAKTEIIDCLETELKLLGLSPEQHTEFKHQEVQAIELSSKNPPDFQSALSLLDTILAQCPRHVSALNNRAQVFQLKAAVYAIAAESSDSPLDEAGRAKLRDDADLLRIQAMSDLNRALQAAYALYPHLAPAKLEALPRDATTRVPVALVQALCQRGVLHRVRGSFKLYREDMVAAAALGSPFAQKELVDMNPIAQLNAEMLPEILKQLRR